MGKVLNTILESQFRPESEHDTIKWISQEEINNYSINEVVNDFHNTLKDVFKNFDEYFR